jgi:hypothetical protein
LGDQVIDGDDVIQDEIGLRFSKVRGRIPTEAAAMLGGRLGGRAAASHRDA